MRRRQNEKNDLNETSEDDSEGGIIEEDDYSMCLSCGQACVEKYVLGHCGHHPFCDICQENPICTVCNQDVLLRVKLVPVHF